MSDTDRRVVALASGGTAGHIYLALAVAEAYLARRPGCELLFLGADGGLEAQLVPRHGHRFSGIAAAPFFGVGPVDRLRAVGLVAIGVRQARRILARRGTDLVLGFGGYASISAVLAARSLRLATAIVEPNTSPGLVNRLLGRVADRVYAGSHATLAAFPSARTRLTGTPVRAAIARLHGTTQHNERRGGRPIRVLVTGGSLGATFLNRNAPPLLARIAARGLALEAHHQTGPGEAAAVRAAYATAGIAARVEELIDDMPAAYARNDFAVSSAGAVTLAELAVARLPALLVPLSRASEDHQAGNARWFAEGGGGLWVREQDWNEALADRVIPLLLDGTTRQRCREALRSMARPEAARDIVEDCEAMLEAAT